MSSKSCKWVNKDCTVYKEWCIKIKTLKEEIAKLDSDNNLDNTMY